MSSKCPKCEKPVDHVNARAMPIQASTKQWRGVSYDCPHCHAILSVALDPAAFKEEFVQDAKRR
jgi:hypothetical protein